MPPLEKVWTRNYLEEREERTQEKGLKKERIIRKYLRKKSEETKQLLLEKERTRK